MNPYALLPLVCMFINIALGSYILYKDPKKVANRIFALSMLAVAIWDFGEAGMRFCPIPYPLEKVIFWNRILWIGVCFMASFFLYFVLLFPRRTKILDKKTIYLILYFPPFVFLYLVWATHLFIKGNIPQYWGYDALYGPAFSIFSVYMSALLFFALFILIQRYFKARTFMEKKQMLCLLTGYLISLILSLITDVIFPLVNIEFVRLGSTANIIWAGFFAYGMVKYKLMLIVPASEEVKSSLAKYNLSPGFSYLVKEEIPDKTYDIFLDQVTHSIQGLCLTKFSTEKVREKYGIEKSPIIWLTFKNAENAISPKDIGGIRSIISDFVKKAERSCLLMDCFEELVMVNGFEQAMRFLEDIKEICKENNSNLLLSIDPKIFEQERINIIEKELWII